MALSNYLELKSLIFLWYNLALFYVIRKRNTFWTVWHQSLYMFFRQHYLTYCVCVNFNWYINLISKPVCIYSFCFTLMLKKYWLNYKIIKPYQYRNFISITYVWFLKETLFMLLALLFSSASNTTCYLIYKSHYHHSCFCIMYLRNILAVFVIRHLTFPCTDFQFSITLT